MKLYLKYFIYWTADVKSGKLWSSLSVVTDGEDEDGLHFEKSSLLPIFKAKPKMYRGLLFLQKIYWGLSCIFQGNILGSSKG